MMASGVWPLATRFKIGERYSHVANAGLPCHDFGAKGDAIKAQHNSTPASLDPRKSNKAKYASQNQDKSA